MKNLKLTLVLIVLMSMVGAKSLAYKVNGIEYTIGDGYAEVTSGNTEYSGSVVIPESIFYKEKNYPVTGISSRAFKNCASLTSVTIPNSVTTIGDEAFYGCSSLTGINLPDNLATIGSYAFWKCSGLTSISIPSSVRSIGSQAFENTGIYNAAPDGVFYVDKWACDYKETTYSYGGVENISLLEGTVGIADFAFDNNGILQDLESITIPNSVTSIGSDAFYGCSKLASVSIPNSVISIGAQAFIGCTSLTSISIPNSVRSIGSQAFEYTGIYNAAPDGLYYVDNWACGTKGSEPLTSASLLDGTIGVAEHVFWCFDYDLGTIMPNPSLTSVTLPNSLKYISDRAFESCPLRGLEAIPSSVTYIGEGAFHGAWSNEGLTIPDSITSISKNAFELGYMMGVTMGNSVTSIGDKAFADCANLGYVEIGDSVTSIGDGAFADCYQLSTVIMGNSVSSIGRSAFRSCNGCRSIYLPNTVAYIGDEAFRMMDLQSIYVDLKTPLSIASSTFYDRTFTKATLYVPVGCKAVYESADVWKNFTNIEEFVALNELSSAVPEPATNVTVYVARTFNDYEWNTICLPFSMTAEQLKTTFDSWDWGRMEFREYAGFEVNGNNVNVNFNTATSLEANHPYIIKPAQTIIPFVMKGVDIVASTDARVSHTSGDQQLDFVGTLVGDFDFYSATQPNTSFFLSGGQIQQASPTTPHMNAFHAYFSYTGESSNLNLVLDEETTGIAESDGLLPHSGRVYDLQGRPMQNGQLRPGLYISNGKKTVIR